MLDLGVTHIINCAEQVHEGVDNDCDDDDVDDDDEDDDDIFIGIRTRHSHIN